MAARETVQGEEVWSIREVYDGKGWTARDAAPVGSTHDELREVLRMMAFDIEHRDFLDLDAGVVAHRSGGLRGERRRPDPSPATPARLAAPEAIAEAAREFVAAERAYDEAWQFRDWDNVDRLSDVRCAAYDALTAAVDAEREAGEQR